MSSENKNVKTVIELAGPSMFIECSLLNDEQLQDYVDSKDDEDDHSDMVESLLANSDISFTGVRSDNCSVLVNGNEMYSDLDEIMNDCVVTFYPSRSLLSIDEGQYAFMHIELEKGIWGRLEIDGEFDETKLVFAVQSFELPDGDDVTLILAQYDGVPLEYDSPDAGSDIQDNVFNYGYEEVA